MGDQYANHARYESATLNMNLNVRKCTFFSFQMRLFDESWNSAGQLIYHDYSLESAVDNVIFAAPHQHGTNLKTEGIDYRGLAGFVGFSFRLALLSRFCSITAPTLPAAANPFNNEMLSL